MDLVFKENGEFFTDSLVLQELLGISNKEILRKIRKLVVEDSTLQKEYIFTEYTNRQGRNYPKCNITRDGFMFFIMNSGAKGEKIKTLHAIQLSIIKAFNELEKQLAIALHNRANEEWLEFREDGKIYRKEFTDTIKDFVDYATSQGSTNANKYYMIISKMENATLELVLTKYGTLRDTLNVPELFHLGVIERMLSDNLKQYMLDKMHYKEIYQQLKNDLIRYLEDNPVIKSMAKKKSLPYKGK